MTFYARKSTRIPGYDYSSANYYFITICTHHRKCIFGKADDLNEFGRIAMEHILQIPSHYQGVKIDKFVVMPNHVHMIVVLDDCCIDVPTLVSLYKAGVTRQVRTVKTDMKVWQRSFHDHIIRDQAGYEKIWLYIESNPQNWEKDGFYVDQDFVSAQY